MGQDVIRQYVVKWFGLALLIAGLYPLPAHAEWTLSIYGGTSLTLDSDVRLKQPGETRLTFHQVDWESAPFKEPQYFGLRLTYWLSRRSPWGLAIDFVHDKMIAELDQKVSVVGRRRGDRVDADEILGDSFAKLEFSHGHNLLTANVFYRWLPHGHRRTSWMGRLQPYIGLGAGVAIPHVEVVTGPSVTGEYQFAGPAFQGLAGIDVGLSRHVSLFVELRLSYAYINADLNGGGSLETDALTYHLSVGLALSS